MAFGRPPTINPSFLPIEPPDLPMSGHPPKFHPMKFNHLPWLLGILVFWTSCQSLYIPSGPNVPLMSEGDELQVGMSIGSNGYGAQIAYSPYYRWAITANGSTYSVTNGNSFSTNVVFRHLYGEVGTGLYTRFSKYVRGEVLGGFGSGYSGHPTDDKNLYRKLYLQPSIGISGPYVDFGFTPRLCWVDHFQDKVNDVKAAVEEQAVFMEPSVTLRAGYEQLKFQVQSGFAFALGDSPFTYRNRFIVMGFHLTFVKDFEKYR
jgi:hypothetical protein